MQTQPPKAVADLADSLNTQNLGPACIRYRHGWFVEVPAEHAPTLKRRGYPYEVRGEVCEVTVSMPEAYW